MSNRPADPNMAAGLTLPAAFELIHSLLLIKEPRCFSLDLETVDPFLDR